MARALISAILNEFHIFSESLLDIAFHHVIHNAINYLPNTAHYLHSTTNKLRHWLEKV